MGWRRRKRNLRRTGSSNNQRGRTRASGRRERTPGEQTRTEKKEGTGKVAQEMKQRTECMCMGLFGARHVGCEYESACI